MDLTHVVIDASMSRPNEGIFCLCPVELNGHREIMEVITGLSVICESLPPERRIVGVYHEEGPKVAHKWLRENLVAVARFCSFDNPELREGSVGRAILRLFSDNHPDDLKPLFGIDELRDALTQQYGIPLP